MTDIKPICRFCKHWGASLKYFSVKKYLEPTYAGGYGWTDRDRAVADVHDSRLTNSHTLPCKVLEKVVEIDIDQGGGWDAGGASVEEISVPGEFGCNKFEPYDTES